ncbi:MAG: HIT family protein [Magnetococcales bacterium]|nr:HIT family protein [Magnetococcales bacterium]
MNQTELHPTLAKDGITVGFLSACQVLLINDSHYPWLILVPDRPGLRDLDELTDIDRALVYGDIHQASQVLRRLFNPTKLNVAALGNMVPQLHIHVIARFEGDKAWPKPVWGLHPSEPYPDDLLAKRLEQLKGAFGVPQT